MWVKERKAPHSPGLSKGTSVFLGQGMESYLSGLAALGLQQLLHRPI